MDDPGGHNAMWRLSKHNFNTIFLKMEIYSSGQKKRYFFSYAVLECSKQKMSLTKVSRSAQKPRNGPLSKPRRPF